MLVGAQKSQATKVAELELKISAIVGADNLDAVEAKAKLGLMKDRPLVTYEQALDRILDGLLAGNQLERIQW